MVKNILMYTGTFVVLLILMTVIVYQQRKGEIEQLRAEQAQMADSLAMADSLKTDSLLVDSLAMADDSTALAAQQTMAGDIPEDTGTTTLPPSVMEETAEPEEVKEYKEVAKIYEKMKPDQAAQVLSGLSDEEKANILMVMKDRQAAKILAKMDPAKASQISQLIMVMKNK